VESSCEFGIELSGSMKCWETIEWLTSSGHSISVQLHMVKLIFCVGYYRQLPAELGLVATLPQPTDNAASDISFNELPARQRAGQNKVVRAHP
jgi:hypothetical protein